MNMRSIDLCGEISNSDIYQKADGLKLQYLRAGEKTI